MDGFAATGYPCELCSESRPVRLGEWACRIERHRCPGNHLFRACQSCWEHLKLREVAA